MNMEKKHENTCPSIQDCQSLHHAAVRLIQAIYGEDTTREDAEKILRDIELARHAKKEKAIRSACVMLRQAERPICRRDMEVAIEFALYQAAKKYEDEKTRDNAVYVLSLAACRKLVYGEPLFEEGED